MTEPIYVHEPEYFQTDDWSPEELRDAAQSMTPATVDQVQRAWTDLGTSGFGKITAFTDSITREIGLSWQGSAASNALDKVDKYGTTAEGVQTKLNEVAGSFQPIYDAASRLKGGAVPEPQNQSLWDDITPWKTSTDDEHYRRHGEAVAAMNNIYRPGVMDTDGNVPVIPRLSETVDPPNPVVPGGPDSGGPSAGPGGPGTPGGPTGAPTDDSPTGTPSTGSPDGATPGAPSDATGAGPSSPAGDQTPATTGAASSVPGNPSMTGMPSTSGASLGDSGRVGGGGLGGGSHGGGGSLGGGAGAFGGGGLVSGAPAGLGSPKGVGSPNGAGGIGAGGRAGAGAAGGGARGAGMGGMMGGGGGRGAGGSDDKEHKTPGYLVTLDNGNELIGKMPAVAPPVIGA